MNSPCASPRKRISLFLVLILALPGALLFAQKSNSTAAVSSPIGPGSWAGELILTSLQEAQDSAPAPASRNNQSAPSSYHFALVVRILAANRGILVDIPEQGMFSYPIDDYHLDANQCGFVLDAMGEDEALTFSGSYSDSFVHKGSDQKGGVVGSVKGRSWSGSFYLQKQKVRAPEGEISLDVAVEKGSLPATLTFPIRTKAVLNAASPVNFPLVILVAGAGKADRNGNNVDVPGTTDTLKQLAEMLRARGVGSLRYDRRGTGEAYKLEAPGHMTGFTRHVLDLAAIIEAALALPRRGRLLIAGMNEGAWMAMATLSFLGNSLPIDGLVVLDASGQSPMETLRQSVENLDPESRAKALEAAQKLVETGTLIDVPENLATFFAHGKKDWLVGWLAFNPVEVLKRVTAPVVLVYGENDMQVSREEFSKLVKAQPSAVIRVIPNMNYVLKEVRSEDENYAAFTDPSFKVPTLLADLLAAYAKVEPSPQGLLPWSQK